jgi:hypothetical protein
MNSSIGDRTPPPASIPVSIVSWSPLTRSGAEMFAHLDDLGCEENPLMDLDRFMLLTPTEQSIVVDLTGAKLVAQRVTFSNVSIVDTMKRVLIESSGAKMNGDRIFFRVSEYAAIAEVVSEREVEMLNTLTHNDDRGTTQVFNAKHFPSLRVHPTRIAEFLEEATQFASAAVVIAPRPFPADNDTYGWAAGLIKSGGSVDWNKVSTSCHKHLKELIGLTKRAHVQITSLSLHGRRAPIIDGLTVRVDPADAAASSYSPSTNTTIVIPRRMQARQYAASQGINGSSQPIVLANPSTAGRRSDTDAGPLPIHGAGSNIDLGFQRRSDGRVHGGGSGPAHNDRRRSRSRHAASGSAQSTPRPSTSRPVWVCCSHGRPNVTMDYWYDKMIGCGCDEGSVSRFMAFSHYSPAAYLLANSLFDKLIMWRRNDQRIKCPSAFIEAGVEKARRELHPEGEKHLGKRKSSA